MSRRELYLGAMLLAGGLLAGGLLAEGAVRVAAELGMAGGRTLAARDPLAVKIEPHGEMGYRQRPGVSLSYSNGTLATSNAMGYRGPLVTVTKPAGTVRILLLGESTTHGWNVDDTATIDDYMRRLLTARYPGRRWEVVNLAYDGYDAYQLFERLASDGLRLQPDLVIANTGINDVRNARFANLQDRDRRTMIWASELDRLKAEREAGGPSAWTWAKHYSFLARLPGVLSRRRTQKTSVRRRLDVTPNPQAVDYFERNVQRIADVLGERGIPLLLSTPPSLLTGPFDSTGLAPRDYWVVDLATTQRYRDSLATRLEGVARRGVAQGRRIAWQNHTLPPELFSDDCHLTPAGNARLAADFVAALPGLLPDSLFSR